MRVVFLGTPALAVPSLAAVAAKHDVTGVVCQPDRPQGRSGKPAPPPVKDWALERGIPVHQPEKLNDGAFEGWLRELAPDIGVLAAYGRFLKQPILDAPPHGWINMHPSLLPRWRGPSPIQAAVLHGDTVSGVTIMRVSMEMDAGDILLQEETPIGREENAAELAGRLAEMGAALLVRALDLVERGQAHYRPQDASLATFSKMLEKRDGFIRWNRPAREIHNLVRACQPWPAAQCVFRGNACKVLKTRVCEELASVDCGTVTYVDKETVRVATASGQIDLIAFQAPGKRAMTMSEFLRGNRIQPGEQFGELG